jgi:hypothetical protein
MHRGGREQFSTLAVKINERHTCMNKVIMRSLLKITTVVGVTLWLSLLAQGNARYAKMMNLWIMPLRFEVENTI